MKKRWIIGAAVLTAGLVVVAISVGVNVGNGSYGKASSLVGSDLKTNAALTKEASRLKKLRGVAKVVSVFEPLHLPNPTASLTVEMKPSAPSMDILNVVRSVSAAWVSGHMPSDLLTLTLHAGSLAIHKSHFETSSGTLDAQVAVWDALRAHTRVPIAGTITDAPAVGAQALTVNTTSGTPAADAKLATAYAISFESSDGLSAGPSWNFPGLTGTGPLPPTAVLRVLSTNAVELPIAEQLGTRFTSGVSLTWSSGAHPDAHLYVGYLSSKHVLEPPALHLTEAAAVAKSLIASGVIGMNFGYEGAISGKLVRYGFFTGPCHGRAATSSEQAQNLSQLGVTVQQLNGGAPGVCLPGS